MRVIARFRTDDGRSVDLGPGDFIGRLPTAALRVNDPRVSEAHALVSLRGGALKLLALRGRFLIDGAPQTEVTLKSGLVVELAQQVALQVTAVVLPSTVMAIDGPGLTRQILPPVASLVASPPSLLPGFSPEADATLWFDGQDFRVRLRGESDDGRVVVPDDTVLVAGLEFRIVPMRVEAADVVATQRDDAIDLPLVLQLRYDTVPIQRGRDHFTIDGVAAMLLTELGQLAAPVDWRVVAGELWRDEDDDHALRQRWDRNITRLRARLRAYGLRGDLVRRVGGGRVELYLHPGDRVQDDT